MTEVAGSVGVVQKQCPLDLLRDSAEKRRIVRQEIRKKELEKKGNEGSLNTLEAMELAGYKFEDCAETIAKFLPRTICYEA